MDKLLALARLHPALALLALTLVLQILSAGAHRVSPRAGQAADAILPLALPAFAAAVSDEPVMGIAPAAATVEPATSAAPVPSASAPAAAQTVEVTITPTSGGGGE